MTGLAEPQKPPEPATFARDATGRFNPPTPERGLAQLKAVAEQA